MNIRIQIESDNDAIETLTYSAFENHPYHAPGAKPTEHIIINKLRNAGALTLSLVAEDETGIIGHIAFSPVRIGEAESNWFGLGPVAVKPERQSEGIGSQLIKAGMDKIKAHGAEGVALLGSPEYYGRFGFKANSHLVLPGVPAEYFLVHPLCNSESTVPVGEVTFHLAFNG
ncbi:GNAT family N-acetyltransferase [Photobacterium minamisatsumaniensis]|uniref:GNAT family N-acetyltransferase n=1 Tax=Photobacterium minamisatsumaniensis TaxID=2910233 RepID=UPI003D1374B1